MKKRGQRTAGPIYQCEVLGTKLVAAMPEEATGLSRAGTDFSAPPSDDKENYNTLLRKAKELKE